MKINHLALLFFLLITSSFPQSADSVKADTLRFDDSTRVILPDSARTDTAALFKSDTLAVDTLIPLFSNVLSAQSNIISGRELHMNDYRNLSDILDILPESFINTTGQYGYPESIYLYGVQPNIMINNVSINSTGSPAYDLNLVQAEMIDSIEVIKAPRGFLYSQASEPAAINLIQKDFIAKIPYTKIKYYEGPDGMALFDGMFSTMAFKKFSLLFDVTNRKGDDTYINSAYSSWQANARIKYYVSPKLNFSASYSYVKTESDDNGGIEIDSVYLKSGGMSGFKDIFYDNIESVVISTIATRDVLQHNFRLNSLWKPAAAWKTDITAYSFFNQNIFNNTIADTAGYKSKLYYYGVTASQYYYGNGFDVNILASYVINESSLRSVVKNIEQNRELTSRNSYFSFAPVISFYLADSSLVPSLFFKYTAVNDNKDDNLSGYGFDVTYKINNFKLYAGGSASDSYLSSKTTKTVEAGGGYSGENFNCTLSLFSISENTYYYGTGIAGASGTGVKLSYSVWKLLFENNSYYYFSNKRDYIPDYKINTGFYFRSMLFNEHLDLKSGFDFSLMPGDYLKSYYTEPAASLFNSVNYKLDFTLAGIISKVATVYFTWENLTNNRYFIIPFHPMPERNIRFGVSWELFN
jgi:hypothetical protein